MPETLKTCSSCEHECRSLVSRPCIDCATEVLQGEQVMTNWKGGIMNRTEAYRKVASIIAMFNYEHDVKTSIEMDHELATKIYDSIVPVPGFDEGPPMSVNPRPWG